jgi:hypothetical protein
MYRVDNSRFLLYIEPRKEEKSEFPLDDEISQIMIVALTEAKTGFANYAEINEPPRFVSGTGYKGYHITDCGKNSTGNDYLLGNGMITNSLATFYIQYYRDSIPGTEMKKVNEVVDYYKNKYPDTLELVIIQTVADSKKEPKVRINDFINDFFENGLA